MLRMIASPASCTDRGEPGHWPELLGRGEPSAERFAIERRAPTKSFLRRPTWAPSGTPGNEHADGVRGSPPLPSRGLAPRDARLPAWPRHAGAACAESGVAPAAPTSS